MEVDKLKSVQNSTEMHDWLTENSWILDVDESPNYLYGQYQNIGKRMGCFDSNRFKSIVIDGNLAIILTNKAADISKTDFLQALTDIWEEDKNQQEDFEMWISCIIESYQIIKAACIVIDKNKE
jgi:hypothetical protein